MGRAPCRARSSSALPRPTPSSSSCDFWFLLLPPSSTLSIGVPFPDDEPPSSPSAFSGFGYPERYAAFSAHRDPQHLAISRVLGTAGRCHYSANVQATDGGFVRRQSDFPVCETIPEPGSSPVPALRCPAARRKSA